MQGPTTPAWPTTRALRHKKGVRHRFHRLRLPSELSAVAQALHARTLNREGRELARLHQVLELTTISVDSTPAELRLMRPVYA